MHVTTTDPSQNRTHIKPAGDLVTKPDNTAHKAQKADGDDFETDPMVQNPNMIRPARGDDDATTAWANETQEVFQAFACAADFLCLALYCLFRTNPEVHD